MRDAANDFFIPGMWCLQGAILPRRTTARCSPEPRRGRWQ